MPWRPCLGTPGGSGGLACLPPPGTPDRCQARSDAVTSPQSDDGCWSYGPEPSLRQTSSGRAGLGHAAAALLFHSWRMAKQGGPSDLASTGTTAGAMRSRRGGYQRVDCGPVVDLSNWGGEAGRLPAAQQFRNSGPASRSDYSSDLHAPAPRAAPQAHRTRPHDARGHPQRPRPHAPPPPPADSPKYRYTPGRLVGGQTREGERLRRQTAAPAAMPRPENAADPLAGHAKYKTVGHLGAGAFGSVVLAETSQNDGGRFAIKLLKRSDVNKYVSAEILNHANLWHPHVSSRVQPPDARRRCGCCCAGGGNGEFSYKPRRLSSACEAHCASRAPVRRRATRTHRMPRRSSSSWRCS